MFDTLRLSPAFRLPRVTRRPALTDVDPTVLYLAIYAALACAFAVTNWTTLATAFRDTDDVMRLVQVRDLLSGQNWFDLHQSRLDPGGSEPMHWSRLGDLPLAILITAFRSVVSLALAEKLAITIWPPLLGVVLLLAVRHVAMRLMGPPHALAIAMLPICCSPLLGEFVPGRIDHHGMQIAAAMWVVALTIDGTPRAALWAGIAGAIGLAVGLEGLVVMVAAGAAFALRAAIARNGSPAASSFATGLAGTLGVLTVALVPADRWLVTSCDAVGANWLFAIWLGCAGLIAAGRSPQSPFVRSSLIALGAAAGALTFAAMDRACLSGPFGHIEPGIRPIWLDLVTEVQPAHSFLSENPRLLATRFVAFLPLAALGVALVVRSRRLRQNPALIAFAIALPVAIVTALLQIRFSTQMLVLAIPFGAVALRWAGLAIERGGVRGPLGSLAALGALMMISLGLGAAAAQPDVHVRAAGQPAPVDSKAAWRSCMQPDAYGELAALPAGLIAAEVDLGPILLLATPHSVLAAPYHRFGRGLLDAHEILSARDGARAAAVDRRDVTYVVTCAGARGWGKDALGDALRSGAAPDWLDLVSKTATVAVYRVKRS